METIDCGSATCELAVDNDGIGTAVYGGLLLPRNVAPIALLALQSVTGRLAKGLLTRVEHAALCCDAASMTLSYPYMTPAQRALPQAFLVNAGQMELVGGLLQRAAAAGLMRAAFYSEAEARAWMVQTTRALDANRDWWARRD